MTTNSPKSILSGVMLTAGTAIGAGMFSLPIVCSGMWFFPSILCFVFIWYLNYLASLYILETNLQYKRGASFDTIVHGSLGRTWNIITGLSIAFLLYILLYAFFSAFGNIGAHIMGLDNPTGTTKGFLSLLLGGVLSSIIWYSSKLVGRINALLMIGLMITFILSMFGLSLQVEATKLFNSNANDTNYISYLWAAFPYMMTSFGFATAVPSLYKIYGAKPAKIKTSLFIGSLLALFVYIVFLFVSFGNISREAFLPINAAGGNMGDFVNALERGNGNNFLNAALNMFSNFAIITSFLGVGLGLFDYISDKFSFPDDSMGRLKTACISFIPSGVLSFFWPNGFITAIGYAGLVCIFGFFIVPVLMAYKTRKENKTTPYKVTGGYPLLMFLLVGCLLVAACFILAKMNYLVRW